VHLDGRRVDDLPPGLRGMRREMQVIFQDPYSSLSPRLKVGSIIAEPLAQFRLGSATRSATGCATSSPRWVCARMRSTATRTSSRAASASASVIARALALNPKLIICDEPVSALDVSVQAQVVNLLKDLQAELGLSYLFIAHDMAVVEHVSHRIAVMYLGKIVEIGERRQLLAEPLHPYTQALLSAVPVPNPKLKRQRIVLKGRCAEPRQPAHGLPFPHPLPLCVRPLPGRGTAPRRSRARPKRCLPFDRRVLIARSALSCPTSSLQAQVF
jgi:oligopeptide/dipeptide ABC transporter ATP-binding protein